MRRIWFDRHEPPVLDHRLTAAAGNTQRAKGGDAAAFSGHLGMFPRTASPYRRTTIYRRFRLGSPMTATRPVARELFADGAPEVSEPGRELVGKSRQERFDRTQKALHRDRF